MTDDQIQQTEAWIAFEDMRKAKGKRAPFTSYAKTRILFELRRLAADGQDPEEVLWTSVTNGWSGVFAIRRLGWQPPTLAQTVQSKDVDRTQDWIKEHGKEVSISEARHREIAEKLKATKARMVRT